MRSLAFSSLVAAAVLFGAGDADAQSLGSPNVLKVSITSNLSADPTVQHWVVDSESSWVWSPTAGSPGRPRYWLDTVTTSGSIDGKVIEPNFFDLELVGTGTIANEAFNVIHPYVYVGSGVTLTGPSEAVEASGLIDGNIPGMMQAYLSVFTNNGTMGTFQHFSPTFTNNGTLGTYITYGCKVIDGNAPTNFNICLENKDPNASIVTSGGVTIGSFGQTPAVGQLQLIAQGHAGSTFPFIAKDDNLGLLLILDDRGSMTVSGSNSSIQAASINATGVYKANGTIGASCTAGTVNLTTLVVNRGIITHC